MNTGVGSTDFERAFNSQLSAVLAAPGDHVERLRLFELTGDPGQLADLEAEAQTAHGECLAAEKDLEEEKEEHNATKRDLRATKAKLDRARKDLRTLAIAVHYGIDHDKCDDPDLKIALDLAARVRRSV